MSRSEFATALAVLAAGCNRKFEKDQVEVYYSLLGDLPLDVFQLAVKRALLEHVWASLPSIAELRQLAMEIQTPKRRHALEAFGLAHKAIRCYGLPVGDDPNRGLESLPSDVRKFVAPLWNSWCESDNWDVIRAHFLTHWGKQELEDKRDRLLPADVKQRIEAKQSAARRIVEGVAGRLGVE